jgi:hypothetical protein
MPEQTQSQALQAKFAKLDAWVQLDKFLADLGQRFVPRLNNTTGQLAIAGQILGTQFSVQRISDFQTVVGVVDIERAVIKHCTPLVITVNKLGKIFRVLKHINLRESTIDIL